MCLYLITTGKHCFPPYLAKSKVKGIVKIGILWFIYVRRAGKAFIDALLPRLNPKSSNGGPVMPFELEVG